MSYLITNMKIRPLLILGTLLVSLFLNPMPSEVSAQAKARFIYQVDDDVIRYISWTTDGQALRFYAYQSWFKYDLKTEQLIPSVQMPSEITLTDAQIQAFEVIPNLLMFVSPDKRYIAYPTMPMPSWSSRPFAYDDSYPIGIADLTTGKHFITDAPAEEGLQIKWSKNDEAFTVSTHNYNGAYRVFYVTGFQPSLTSATVTNASDGFPEFTEVGQQVPIYDVLDISSDGKKVLFWNTRQKTLYRNFADPSQSKVLLGLSPNNSASNITFSAQDDTKLRIIDPTQSYLYDIKDGTRQKGVSLAQTFASIGGVQPETYISPTGNAAALLVRVKGESFKMSLYVVDLPDLAQ